MAERWTAMNTENSDRLCRGKIHTILLVHNYYQQPGGEDHVVENERELLQRHGHDVILYTRHNSELKEMGVVKRLLLPFATVFNIKTYRDIKKIIWENQVDVVHVHNTLNLISPAVYYASLKCRVPVVQTLHNFRLLCPNGAFYRDGHICEDCVKGGLACAVRHGCYRESRAQTFVCAAGLWLHRKLRIYCKLNYICLTEFNREKMIQLKQIDRNRLFVKPNFMTCKDGFLPAHERENDIVFAGRLTELKGVRVLLEAWKLLPASGPKLSVYGEGPLKEYCKQFAAENNVNIEIMGFREKDEIVRAISNCRALILPTQWYEGFPMSIVEAFSVGTPVLCSDMGNTGALVSEGINGFKFSPDSPEEIKNAVSRLCGAGADIYDNTRAIYIQKYSENVNYRILTEIYKAI